MTALLKRAMATHLRTPGALQPSGRSSSKRVVNGLRYVELANGSGTLAVYRVKPDGKLRRLKRWPKWGGQ